MAAAVYLGDEVSAAGFRLAGAETSVPGSGTESAALAGARADALLVLVSAAVAARIPEDEMRGALSAILPLTLIVPDLRGEAQVPDIATRLRHQLGLEE